MNQLTPLVPKIPGGPLRVLMLGRTSADLGDLQSVEAGHRAARLVIGGMYSGPLEVKRLGDRGSGLRTGRDSITEAEAEVATGTWDLVIAPDLGRIYRNPRHLYAFVQDAVDRDTRLITVWDHFDTADRGWELRLKIAAAARDAGFGRPGTSTHEVLS